VRRACPGLVPLASPSRVLAQQAAKPLALWPGRPPRKALRLTFSGSPRRLAKFLRSPRLVFRRSQRGTRPDKHIIAARPTRLLVVIMDCIPLDRFDLSDEQAIAVKIPSTDNQVPRLDFLCAAHSHDPTHVPAPKQLRTQEKIESPPNPKTSPSQTVRSLPSIPATKRISSLA